MSYVSVRKASAISLVSLLLFTNSAFAASTASSKESNASNMTTSQVKTAIKKKHKGTIISIKKKPTAEAPNCHIVKLKTPTGGIKYIRYSCK